MKQKEKQRQNVVEQNDFVDCSGKWEYFHEENFSYVSYFLQETDIQFTLSETQFFFLRKMCFSAIYSYFAFDYTVSLTDEYTSNKLGNKRVESVISWILT